MRREVLSITMATLVLASCSPSVWDGDIVNVGTLCDVMRDGHTEARVDLAGLEPWRDLVAVGALEGLQGEVTIVGGEVWTSRSGDGWLFTQQKPGSSDRAAMLLSATVPRWIETAVAEDVSPADTPEFIRRAAAASGIDTSRPFPFQVDGRLHRVRAYVIAGECPMRAQMNGDALTSPPYTVVQDELRARLVGFYADEREGEMTYHGTRMHAHVIVEGPNALTGHVDTVGLRAGSTLRLPAR